MSGQEITPQHVQQLESADTRGYWWYVVRQLHVERHLADRLHGRPMEYLDLGCGAGGVLSAVTARFAPKASLGLDGTRQAVEIAKARGLDARFADFRAPLELPFAPNAATCLDVLEHLEDPVLALKHLAAAMQPDARLVVTVPAMPSLFSAWDEHCDHHRRYSRALLREHLRAGGFLLDRCRYVFSYCVPPAFWQRRVVKAVQEMEFPPVSPFVNRAMIVAGRLEAALGCPFPFGTSLLATARPAPRA